MMTKINVDTAKARWYITDAWRASQEPDAINEAIKIGAQVVTFLNHAISLIEAASRGVDPIMPHTILRCRVISNQLAKQVDRLIPILARLQAASKAVDS